MNELINAVFNTKMILISIYFGNQYAQMRIKLYFIEKLWHCVVYYSKYSKRS